MENELEEKREVPKPSEQKEIIKKIIKKHAQLKVGEIWCIIDKKWYDQWKSYCSFEGSTSEENKKMIAPPGEIDNKKLIIKKSGDIPKLVRHLTPKDFSYIAEPVWNQLFEWFGGGPVIKRKVVKTTHLELEVYPLFLQMKKEEELSFQEFEVSGYLTFETFYQHIAKAFHLVPDSFDVYLSLNGRPYRILSLSSLKNRYLNEIFRRIYAQEIILIERGKKRPNLKWKIRNLITKPKKKTGENEEQGENEEEEKEEEKQEEEEEEEENIKPISSRYRFNPSELKGGNPSTIQGLCGLKNLCNSCYLNSSLQCLTKISVLRDFFSSNFSFNDQINMDNPLGMRGKMAKAFYRLIQNMYSMKYGYLYPRECKYVIERFNPQYMGTSQQDASEFTVDVLRALHEDVKKTSETATAPISRETAMDPDLSWAFFQSIESSIITDSFYGQYRNLFVCSSCGHEVKYHDPFLSLMLPIPSSSRSMPVKFLFKNHFKTPVHMDITGKEKMKVKDLKNILSEGVNKSEDSIQIVQAESGRIIKIVDDEESFVGKEEEAEHEEHEEKNNTAAQEKSKKEVIGYEITKNEGEKWVYVRVADEVKNRADPFLICAQIGKTTGAELYSKCLKHMNYYIDQKIKRSTTGGSLPEEKLFTDGNPVFSLFYDNENENHISYDHTPFKWKSEDVPRIILRLQNIKSKYVEKRFEQYTNQTHSAEKLDLLELVKSYTKKEKIVKKCEKCGDMNSSKKIDLWRLPKAIVISLKRFKIEGISKKIKSHVEFPIKNLCLGNLSPNEGIEDSVYDLVGVCNHYGSLITGHYSAFVKLKNMNNQETWHKISDESYSEIKESDVCTSDAYILFYEKRETEE